MQGHVARAEAVREQVRDYVREALRIQAQGGEPPVFMQAVAGAAETGLDRAGLLCLINELRSAFCESGEAAGSSIYFWYDALAGQLRACIGEMRDGEFLRSPFSCKVNLSATIEDVLADTEAELSSLHGSGSLDVHVQERC